MTITNLPNLLTARDDAFLNHLLYNRYLSNTLYGQDGERYEQEPLYVALLDKDGILFTDLRKSYEYDLENRTFIHKETGAKHALSNYVCVINQETDEMESISLDLIQLVPRGKLFEQYKSELVIAPYILDGKYNFGDEGVADILENHLGINPDGSNSDINDWDGYYLIYHPVNPTHVCYFPEAEECKFDVTYQNEVFNCDSLDLALMMTFGWAVSECDYQLNDASLIKEL